jgi:gliding motility-associated-like protein
VRFTFKVVDSSANIVKDSIIQADRGGRHVIRIVATHFGCETESDLADTVYLHGPFLKLGVRFIDCKETILSIKPKYSWATKVLLTKEYSDTLDHKKPETITPYGDPIVLQGWNDTFGCHDSVVIHPEAAGHTPEIKYSLDQNCAPAKASLTHNGTLKDAKWIFPNGDTSLVKKVSFIFKEPGVHRVYLVGHYDSSLCQDTNVVMFNVLGGILRGSVAASGKCMPITLTLVDSMIGKDNNFHTWKIGDDIIETKDLTTLFNVQSMPQKDSMISVKHIVQGGNGCISEKEYLLPFGGPVASYLYQRFTICDTPVFYFKSFIDSSLTKHPVTYKWEMSSGLVSNAQNLSSKFRTMGMNYFDLSITDKHGCKSIFHDSFEVSPNMLQPLFKADPIGRFCPPLQCQFTDFSKTFNSEIVLWEWEFGDGTTSQLRNPQKLYLIPGSYDITLRVTSKSGCTATLKKPGYIIVNGPRGSYDFDRGNGCLPHTVGFKGKTLDSATMEWDLGDGVVREGNNFKHIYKQRGRYIPAMILSDTLGCKYTLPPVDTIEVFDYPDPLTTLSGLCYHQPIKVSHSTVSNHEDPSVKVNWYFNGKQKSPGSDSMFMPESRGYQTVRLIAENKGKCKDTFDNTIRIFAPVSDFSIAKDFVCLGNASPFINKAMSDTSIVFYEWDFGDGTRSNNKTVQHTYLAPGKYNVTLIARDAMNCEDTITWPEIAVVGDTVSPPLVPIRRASVISNRNVELVFAKYPTFDFTKYTIYREANNKYYRMGDVNSITDTVFVDPQCNTLKESYCYKVSTQNLCLYSSDLNMSREHCTIETKATGYLDANRVSWSPYIGFDSISRYQVWRQDYDNGGPYELLDSVSSTNLNYVDTLIMCNTRKNYRIKAIQFGGFSEYSFSDTAAAKPYYINTTKPNYAWRATVENNEFARVEWLNNAWSRNGIRGYLLSKKLANGNPVFDYRYFDAMDTVYEDKLVKVNERSYIYNVRGIDNCNDTTPLSNIAQTILLTAFFDKATQKPALKWNHYQLWDQKVAYYEIEQKQDDGSFIVIGKVGPQITDFIDMNARPNCSPFYVYRVRAVSFIHNPTGDIAVSLSNEAQAFPHSTLYVPNAFSPDANEINEKFGPRGQYITRYKFQVFNRWGEKMFETTDCMVPWDGTFLNEKCPQEVYLYRIEALGSDNKTYNLEGTFTLLR